MVRITLAGLIAGAAGVISWLLLYPAKKAQREAVDTVGDTLGSSLDSLKEGQSLPPEAEFTRGISSWILHHIELIFIIAAIAIAIAFIRSR